MTCPRCHTENPPQAKFCLECAAFLARRCPGCGTSLPPTAKFCVECAHPVTGPGSTPSQPGFAAPDAYTPPHLAEKILTSKSALEGERKQVTVLFADLKGSMELLADRDPEEARKLLDPVLERMMEAVHRYEGTVNQVMGDGIMALFGAPVAHEDHAIRACYAALKMQETVNRYGEELRRAGGTPVQIRVGLNSGEVVVRSIGSDLRMDYTAVGQTTHLAARMEQIAHAGSVLVTSETLKLVEGYVQVNPLGGVLVKGLDVPVEVYEVTGVAPVRTRLQATVARGLTRFVGRDAELDQLRHALDRAGAGHGQVAAIVGEPGVGKSRLVWEFTHSHRTQGWLILESSSASYGKATPYLPVIDLLKGYFKIQDRDDQREVRDKVIGRLFGLDRALEPTLPAFFTLLDVPVEDSQWQALDPPQRRQRTLEGVKRLLLRESQVQPLLALFEDLHWIDAETQALLDSVVESLPTARVFLLVNYRPEYEHHWGHKSYYAQLRLDPLPPESAQELLTALLGSDESVHPVKQLLIDRAEGNPLFLEECVRTLVETDVLVGERGAYRVETPVADIRVPPTVQAVLTARIDRLPPDEKRLLQAASVIGETVPLRLLQAVVRMSEEELRQTLGHLQAVEFLYETSLYPDLEYTFKHGLTYQLAYHSVLEDRRRALHARIVTALEEFYPDRLAEHVERLAHHAFRGQLWDKALPYLRQAGQRAIERSANAEAINHLTKGLGVLEALPDARVRAREELALQTALGPPLIASKGYAASEVKHAYSRAVELSHQVGDTPEVFRAVRGLWNWHLVRGELHTARELADQLLALDQRAHEAALLVEARRATGTTYFWLAELSLARSHLAEGIGLYDPEHHRTLAFVYGADPGVVCRIYAAWSAFLLGHLDQAVRLIGDAVALAHEVSHPFSLAFALAFSAVLHVERREGHAAREQAEAAVGLSAERGIPQWLALGRVCRSFALVLQGQVEEGIREARHGLAEWRALGLELCRPWQLAWLAEAYRRGGQVEEGVHAVAEALALVETTAERSSEADLHRLRGDLLLMQAGPGASQAECCFEKAIEVARGQQARLPELRAATSLARLWRRQDKRKEAFDRLDTVYQWFTEGFDTADLQEAKALLDELS